MVKITATKGEKADNDKRIEINGVPIGYEEVSRQVQRLRDKYGEEKVRKILKIPNFKHRKHKIPPLNLNQMNKVIDKLYKNEDRLFPPSKGKQGRKMLQQKLSRDLFRTRKTNN